MLDDLIEAAHKSARSGRMVAIGCVNRRAGGDRDTGCRGIAGKAGR
jgi:hypothetical protein